MSTSQAQPPTSNATTSNGTAVPAASSSSNASASRTKPDIQPSEVGWLFVPEYYTFLNQNPDRLHCFYTKKSTMTHGNEQEETGPSFGQQQIHDKITSLGFENAKVFVSNVDSQSSASGGILIQVLGEISNKEGPWRKFAQTFFLAEQPNGYYVLNDIFRYLKDDEEIEHDADQVVETHQHETSHVEKKVTEVVPPTELAKQSDAVPRLEVIAEAPDQDSAVSSDEKTDVAPASEAETVKVNGTTTVAPTEPVKDASVEEKVAVTAVAAAAPATTEGEKAAETDAAVQDKPAAAAAASTLDAPKQDSTNSTAAVPAAAPAQPAAPPKPKTWANLAASDVSRWGSNISAEAKGVSSSRPVSTTSAKPVIFAGNKNGPATSTTTTTTTSSAAAAGATSASNNIQAQVYIKNVNADHVQEVALRQALESQFGPLKEVQLIPSRACAFAEFVSADAARKAIAKGQVSVGKNGWNVVVEEKRKPTDRPQGGAGGPRSGGPGGPRGNSNNNNNNSSTNNNVGRGGSSSHRGTGNNSNRGGRPTGTRGGN